MTKKFSLAACERGVYGRVAFLCRYLHAPLSEVLSLTRDQAEMLEDQLASIVAKENGR